jgi:methylmalonic aciduria homocystinuria type C protein
VDLYAAVAAALAGRGLELAAPLCVPAYDAAVAAPLRLPRLGRAAPLALVVGNTRALWPRFVAARRAEPDPLDRFVEREVAAALADAAPGIARAVQFAHEAPVTVAIQRAAAIAGLAHLSASHLSVHPTYGPWIALRAVIVLDADGVTEAPPPVPPPCDCATGCGPAFAAALAAGVPSGEAELRERWRLWLAVRDACPVGRAHRYGDAQLRYHYTKDPAALG